jgi:hypothetical protein
MYSFKQFITEKKFQDISKGQKDKWFEINTKDLDPETDINAELFGLIDKSYSYLGGHVGYKKARDIPHSASPDPNDVILWYATDIDDDPEPDIVTAMKKTKFGLKSIMGATDTSSKAKVEYINNLISRINSPGNYGEVSGSIGHILLKKYKVPHVGRK